MTTEFEKMNRGEWYDANFDAELIQNAWKHKIYVLI